MINPDNDPAENPQPIGGLSQVRESELAHGRKVVAALHQDRRIVPLSDSGFVEEGSSTPTRLQRSNDEATQLSTIRQAKDTLAQLHNWDNEGGSTDDTPVELEPIREAVC